MTMTNTLDPAATDRFTKYANTLLITEPLRDPIPVVTTPRRVLVDGCDITCLFPRIGGLDLCDLIGLGFDQGALYVQMVLFRAAVTRDTATGEVWVGRGWRRLQGIEPFQLLTPPDPVDLITVVPPLSDDGVPGEGRAVHCARVSGFFGSVTVAPRALDRRVAT
jgi:hypothetical protein